MNEDADDHRRLGKRELGRHAFEERMPARILALLENEDDSNCLSGVIPNLRLLLEHDQDIQTARLCTGMAVQVFKLPDEGAHFCGYRNIQMLCLAVGWTESQPGSMRKKIPVPQLQSMIEKAWSIGFNPHGLALTGGIEGTRKHIGTSEAEALLLSLDIPCTGSAFHGKNAWRELLDFVEEYFGPADDAQSSVRQTDRPPIFLSRPNHSITIVGIEQLKSGKRHLLTFDPAWQPPNAMRRPLSRSECTGFSAQWVHRLYRKSERYLRRFSAFETLSVGELQPRQSAVTTAPTKQGQ